MNARNPIRPDHGLTPTQLAHCTTYGYDALNHLQSVTAPDLQTTAYIYDAVGNLFQKTDPQAAKSQLIFPSASYTKKCSTPISPPGDAQAQQQVERAWSAAIGG